jgi:SAM-dependent methyltransferase
VTEPYDRSLIARIFDEYGDAEWERHERSPFGRVGFHIHLHYLQRFVQPGDRVLEVGAGAGRFTVELARLGASTRVVDISRRQLDLNAEHVAAAGLEHAVEERRIADVLDLSAFKDGGFDVAVCYGGPLSWVLDGAERGLGELLRVTRPGGHVLVGVCSRVGTFHAFLGAVAEEIDTFGLEEMQDIFDTGYLPDHHSTLGRMHLFTWAELRALLETQPCELVAASASNLLSTGNDEVCERWIRDDPPMWERFLSWEVEACAAPGAIDMGTHIIAVVQRR